MVMLVPIRLGLACIVGGLLGWFLALHCEEAGVMPAHLSPAENAWITYVETERLILLRGPSAAGKQLAQDNATAYHDLMSLGELVRIEYGPTDHETDMKIHQELARLGCKDFRSGFSVDGGQWPAGLVTVEKTCADSFRRIVDQSAPAQPR